MNLSSIMTQSSLKPLSALIQDVLNELEGHPNRMTVEELYDSDEALASALNRVPGFEYPDVAHLDVKGLREYYEPRLRRAVSEETAALRDR